IEYKDFQCFSKVHTEVKTFNCDIKSAEWMPIENGRMVFVIIADRFLRNMVRAIVGTMLDIGYHKITITDFEQIIESKQRQRAGMSVDAKGLFLHKVSYAEGVLVPL